jgi:hypothetical protein
LLFQHICGVTQVEPIAEGLNVPDDQMSMDEIMARIERLAAERRKALLGWLADSDLGRMTAHHHIQVGSGRNREPIGPAPGRLGLVHGEVGPVEQCLRIVAMVGEDGDPDAAPDAH